MIHTVRHSIIQLVNTFTVNAECIAIAEAWQGAANKQIGAKRAAADGTEGGHAL